jgi:hypothetical protein
MLIPLEKPLKTGNEITVRVSLTFQEAPDIHTLLAMTPVRMRGKLVRLALERYIAETAHPAGDVEQQITAISNWLRSRSTHNEMPAYFIPPPAAHSEAQGDNSPSEQASAIAQRLPPTSQDVGDITEAPIASSINRWLDS